MSALTRELEALRDHLRHKAAEPSHDIAIGTLARAEVAAQAGNGVKALACLTRTDARVFEHAKRIGTGMVAAILQAAHEVRMEDHP